MLSALLVSKQNKFDSIAEAWLITGATRFSIWDKERMLACWPKWGSRPVNGEVGLEAFIHVAGQKVGKLQVDGLADELAKVRLSAEADLVVELLKLEEELESMTAQLVMTQDQLLAFYNLSQSTRNSLNIDEVLYPFLEETMRITQAEGGFITLNAGDQPILVEQFPSRLFDQALLQHFFLQTKAANHELLLHADDEVFGMLPNEAGIKTMYLKSMPIRNKTTVMLGVLLNQPASALSPYLKLVRAIVEYAGAQLENVLLYEDTLERAKMKAELDLAARIQTQLLPRIPPTVAGLQIAAASKPALQVGGDFYDFVVQSDSPFTFVVGDVSGKGVSAAMIMAMMRTAIRHQVKQIPSPRPAELLSLCTRAMYDDFTDVGMFASVFVGQYDLTDAVLTYANAGHSPVIYCPAQGQLRMLEADSPPVGMLPESLAENHSVAFGPDDVLVVATDGFSEATRTDEEMFGYERLQDLIKTVAHQSAQEILTTLYEAVNHFVGDCPQSDDQTMIVIKGVG